MTQWQKHIDHIKLSTGKASFITYAIDLKLCINMPMRLR